MIGARRRHAVAFAVASALALAALVYDPRALAAEPKRVLGLAIAAVALAAWVARSSPTRPVAWGPRAALGFVALSAASLAWGLPSGARDLGAFVAAVGAGALAAQLGPRFATRIARVAAMEIGAISGAIAIASAARGVVGMQLHAGQGNPNWLGLLLAVTLPISLDALVTLRRARLLPRVSAAVATLVQIPALYLSHSRVGWIAAALACAFLVVARLRALRLPAAAAVGFVILFAAGGARAEQDVPAGLALEGRVWIWRQTASVASGAVPFGAGLGRFGHAFLDAQGKELERLPPPEAARRFVNATTAHDEYLQVAAESGPIASVLLLCAFFLGARDHARARWFGGAAALLSCAVACLADSPLRQPAVALMTGFVLGVPLLRTKPRARRIAPLLVGLALVAWLFYDATRGWFSTRERFVALEGDPAARASRLAKSARLDPGSGDALVALGLERIAQGDARGGIEALERANRLVADTGARIAIGSAHLTLDELPAAERAYRDALAWNSGSFRARAGLAQALLAERRVADAERQAEIARRLLPGDPRIVDLIDRIREEEMDE